MLRRFWSFARPYRLVYLRGLAYLLATNALVLLLPWLLRGAVATMERGGGSAAVAGFAAAMVGAAMLQAVTRTLSRLAILGNSRRIVFDVRNRFFAQLQRLGGSYFDAHRTGDIMSRGVNDLILLRSFYGPGVLNLLNTSIVYVGTLVLLLRIDARLTAVALLPYPVLFLAVNRLSRRVFARSVAVQQQLGRLSNHTQENLSGIQQVKAYAQEEREIATFRGLCEEFRRRNLSMAALRGAMLALIGGVAGVGTLIVLLVGGSYVVQGRISFPDFVAFHGYLALLAWPTIALGWIVNVFQRGIGAMQRVSEVLDVRPDVPPAADEPDAAPPAPLDGDIEIRGLTFAYGGADGPASGTPRLRDLHLTIRRGERIALVGGVGSGKSTLANLLARIYPCPPGTVRIGGEDLNDIPVGRLRRSLGYVPQESFLFSRPLRDNIALGDASASDEDVARAVALAHLADDVQELPEGLATVVGERGYTLSGGQRQRTTLARALLGDPRILILDDSLSSVDAHTERGILDGLEEALRDRTCILISHRLSTLTGVDRIVVLEDGRVVEEGSHEELLRRDGAYAGLFRRHLLEERLEAS